MIKNMIILIVVLSFSLTSPVFAIGKKTDNQNKKQATVTKKSQDNSTKANPDQNYKQTPKQKKSSAQPPKPKSKPKQNDRFIDRNDDGINDSMKKPKTVKIKKKNEPKSGKVNKKNEPKTEKEKRRR